jgi:environmental stress-induced protein Ves
MNLVRLSDVPPQPWRNGGGTTRALLAWPGVDDWQLRVSVATIATDGDFSAWPDTERWIAVVEGAGVTLALPDGDVTLLGGDPPHRFSGDAAPGCKLLDGPTQDLNLMVRRPGDGLGSKGGVGDMRRAFAGSRASGIADWRGLYAADALTLELDGAVMPVAAGTLLWLADDQPVGWQVQDRAGDARAWWLSWRAP